MIGIILETAARAAARAAGRFVLREVGLGLIVNKIWPHDHDGEPGASADPTPPEIDPDAGGLLDLLPSWLED
jgi:hypothetical protein